MNNEAHEYDETLTDGDVERISQRVAELLFHKMLRRIAVAARVSETVPLAADRGTHDNMKTTPEAAAKVRARRARKGL